MSTAEATFVGLSVVGGLAGVLGACIAAFGNKTITARGAHHFLISFGRVLFTLGVALAIGGAATAIGDPLGETLGLRFTLGAGALGGTFIAVFGGWIEEAAKDGLEQL